MKKINWIIIAIIILIVGFFSIVWIRKFFWKEPLFLYEKSKNQEVVLHNWDEYELLEVIDWDTIRVLNWSWETLSVRMIGIDAPERYTKRYWYIECFWKEAEEYLKSLLDGAKYIQIETDETQWKYDRYERLLWYLFLSWENINQKMITNGYVREYTYNLPYKYQSDFQKSEQYAKENQLWLWSSNTCNWERIELAE
jgi:endonuclease YncB( thermonuclease family)